MCCACLNKKQVIFFKNATNLVYKCTQADNNNNNPFFITTLILLQENVSVSVFRI